MTLAQLLAAAAVYYQIGKEEKLETEIDRFAFTYADKLNLQLEDLIILEVPHDRKAD